MLGVPPVIPTFHGPLCVAATAPDTVVEPLTGSGNGDTMATFVGPLPWSWADACREFMIVPITASRLNAAAAIKRNDVCSFQTWEN
jgi:hypothetical protein